LNEQISGPAAGLWDRQTAGTSPTCAPHTGAAMARFNAFSYSSGTRGMLVTPMLNFVDDNYEVDFWMYRDNGYAGYEEGVKVYYNTSPNLTDAELLGIIHRNSNMTPIVAANGWYEYNFMESDKLSGRMYDFNWNAKPIYQRAIIGAIYNVIFLRAFVSVYNQRKRKALGGLPPKKFLTIRNCIYELAAC